MTNHKNNAFDLNDIYSFLCLNYGLNKSKSVCSGIYSKYPKIFSKIFKVDNYHVQIFEALSKLYIDHILFIDQLCENKSFDLSYIIEKYVLGNELVRQLSYIFKEDSLFWKEYRSLYKFYFKALTLEDNYKKNHNIPISKEDYIYICKNKGALSKLFVFAMALISDNLDIYSDIEIMLDNLNIYIQILDDIKDLKKDLEEEYLTLYSYKSYSRLKTFDYKLILNDMITNNIFNEAINDINLYLCKCNFCYSKYKNEIPLFQSILDEQFNILNLIKERIGKFVCK